MALPVSPALWTLCKAGLVFITGFNICMLKGKHEAVNINSSDHVAFSVFTFHDIKHLGYFCDSLNIYIFAHISHFIIHLFYVLPPPLTKSHLAICSVLVVHHFTIFTAVSTIFTADANKCRESIFVLIPPSVPLLLRQIYLKWKNCSYTVWGKSLEYDF